jgi:DNA-binding NtrC family response regulator
MMKKLLADSNIAIMMCGMRMCKCLASGLRKSFSHGAKILAPIIMSKLRDKKTQVTDETHKTLSALFHSISLEDMLESIKEGMTDKVPSKFNRQERRQNCKITS